MLNLMFWRNSATIQTSPVMVPSTGKPNNLYQAPAGRVVKIAGFGQLNATQRQHLQAYGLLPGRSVTVLSQKPVTIILIEQTELAFENDIARQIILE